MIYWLVLFVYVEVMVLDFIEDFFEMDIFGGYLDIIFFVIILFCYVFSCNFFNCDERVCC